MHVKKGDNVIVLSGKDKGKTGKIIRAFPRHDEVLVEGVNAKKVHERSTKREGKGTIIEKNFPIHVSNVKKVVADSKK
ncbi:MAG: 50S ribosomal protein L24 [Parcubacteria group bacterium GW2011_GWB1_38_8]|uniref:Large ribosomal subunit protein uL24 n=1 Tax=Candidatus Zambryskibacteria bacterium RIFCSPLOWO2_02_FULL_39_14 TaxID=1802769 RepID=A0A1G2UIV8_9BACT|nr:MAG: 50S ribosomal protein L24 [Parcubacteria group bacterium GW2011_GWB1_38_8]KKR30893.1 MAG: 50S ribosomal protein L24 [Parcubacteria group bacterium GW2011_GWC1_39_8]OHA94768.1 MAG: 50S ribosomal protein L24 [Candidatus Zambryskibacteria bacterium RIFCSPHIGHO2_02_FULL_39_16]OHB09343.1 MAG: 50S ribosomal protein L24 [Candidatus Zambryskibacteria bacterium RIFCSPLOWO2_02_FULL_39_14]